MVAVIVAAIVAVSVLVPEKYVRVKNPVFITQCGENVVVIPNGKSKAEIGGRLVYFTASMDGTVAAALIRDVGDDNKFGYSLYLITDHPELISDGVDYFVLAGSGSAIAYCKNHNPNRAAPEATAELWLYSGGKSKMLANKFSALQGHDCAISPDGNTVAYTAHDGKKDIGFVWRGKASKLGEDVYPFAVSNDAKFVYFYYTDTGDRYAYVQSGTNSDSRVKLGKDISSIHANKDFSQIIFVSGASSSYMSRNGGKAEPISGTFEYFILPDNVTSQRLWMHAVAVYGISDFSETYYRSFDDSLIYIDGDYKAYTVESDISTAVCLSVDGKSLTYLKVGIIYKMDGKSAATGAEIIVDGGVKAFAATSDGNAVFYTNDSGIYYKKGSGEPYTISTVNSDISEGLLYGMFKGRTYFYVRDSKLYSSTGGKGAPVSGIDGNVQFFIAPPQFSKSSLLVSVTDGNDTLAYYSTDGTTFELIG
jgi:hypothetical protein